MKSHSKKKQQRRRAAKNRRPDNYFAAGPFEFARFGRVTVSKSSLTLDDWNRAQAKMVADFPTVVTEIDALVMRIAARVARLPAEQLLQRAWWEHAGRIIGRSGKDVTDFDRLAAMRMIDYVQSLIASVPPVIPQESAILEEEWAALQDDVATLFTRLSRDYQISRTAHRRASEPDLEMDLEDFRFRVETVWMNIRGERYHVHERQALADLILPHSHVLVRLFGINSETLVAGMDRMLHKLTSGLQEALLEMEEFREKFLNRLVELSAEQPDMQLDVLRTTVLHDPALSASHGKLGGELFGLDLFDVEKVTGLPAVFVNELTWSPGEEDEFFAPGDFRGWPLRVWPTMKRPFIRLQGRVLCFDVFSLFDNFYRTLQRIVFRMTPDYRQTWNERQKQLSETLPCRYLERLLVGVQVHQPVFYRAKSRDGRAEWCECDGILAYDDHLIIVEIKAGAFTYTSPATDLPAHIESLKNLVRNPAKQGERFLEYLESAAEVSISDRDHNEVGRLRRADFRHVTVCAVTLDPFTELAARARHLRKVGVDIGERAIWALSIDDLRVYADLFDNPLVFLHFVEQRTRAAASELVDLNDELDHLGLYLKENNYSLYASQLAESGPAHLVFDGYRTRIDEYYNAVFCGEVATVPRQDMPARLAQIITFLGASSLEGRSEIASFLLDLDGRTRKAISSGIDRQLRENSTVRRPKPLSTHGEAAFTVFTWSPAVSRAALFAKEHTMAVLAAAGETSRMLLEFEYSEAEELVGVHWQRVTLAGLSDPELSRIHKLAAGLRAQRLTAARERGKVGRNHSCPCGSGKKYKKCCRR